MDKQTALEQITKALKAVVPDFPGEITLETDLVEDGILDSLDSMNFLFHLEEDLGAKIDGIDEDYEDFKVSSLVELVTSPSGDLRPSGE